MKLPGTVRFADESVQVAVYALRKGDDMQRQLFKWILAGMDDLEENAFCGIQVQKRCIPRIYVQKFGISNLWKYNLPQGWRLLYTVEGDKPILFTVILEWLNHKKYEKKFNF